MKTLKNNEHYGILTMQTGRVYYRVIVITQDATKI